MREVCRLRVLGAHSETRPDAYRFSVSRIMPDIVSPSAFDGESFSLSEPGGACFANSFEIENFRHVEECESDADCSGRR